MQVGVRRAQRERLDTRRAAIPRIRQVAVRFGCDARSTPSVTISPYRPLLNRRRVIRGSIVAELSTFREK